MGEAHLDERQPVGFLYETLLPPRASFGPASIFPPKSLISLISIRVGTALAHIQSSQLMVVGQVSQAPGREKFRQGMTGTRTGAGSGQSRDPSYGRKEVEAPTRK